MEIKGITTINHNIRVKLKLTLHEYTLLYFLSEWHITNKAAPSKQDYWLYLGVNSEDATIKNILANLFTKGFLNTNQTVTDKWNSEFRLVVSPSIESKIKPSNKAKNSRSKSVSAKKEFIPPTQKEVEDFFKENDYQIIAGEKAFKYYKDGNWTDKTGTPVVNWKQKMRANWFKDEYKIAKLQNKNMGENLIELGNNYKK